MTTPTPTPTPTPKKKPHPYDSLLMTSKITHPLAIADINNYLNSLPDPDPLF